MYRCGLGGAEKRKYARHCSEKQNPKGPGGAKRAKEIASRSAFGVTLGLLCGHFGVTLRTLGLLWLYRGYFIIIFVRFQKTHIFPTDFNDLMYLRAQLGVTLGSIFMKIMEDNGRKVKNGPPKRHIDVEWHL